MKRSHAMYLTHLQEQQLIERHGVRVRVLGDLSRLPESVAAAARRCMEATQHQRGCVLNICFAYTCAWTPSLLLDASVVPATRCSIFVHFCFNLKERGQGSEQVFQTQDCTSELCSL